MHASASIRYIFGLHVFAARLIFVAPGRERQALVCDLVARFL